MKIFVSYSREDHVRADEIALRIIRSGHEVFFDRESLRSGEEYDDRIRSELSTSDIFLFLISSESIRDGSYSRTELKFARARWPSPDGCVLPVMVRPTSLETIPAYLRSISILYPEGNIPAEVAAEIDRLCGQLEGRETGSSNMGKRPPPIDTPYLALLLKPTFHFLGQELKTHLKEKIDDWKAEKRARNLAGHFERSREHMPSDQQFGSPSFENVESFEAWVEGAQDIDPEDETLGGIWQRLLADIAQGENVQKTLIEALKTISAAEARTLLKHRRTLTRTPMFFLGRFGNSVRFSTEEEHQLNGLRKKGIVTKSFRQFILATAVIAIISSVFSITNGLVHAWINVKLATYGGDDAERIRALPKTLALIYHFSWSVLLVGVVAVSIWLSYSVLQHGLAQWKVTWIGESLLRYASGSANGRGKGKSIYRGVFERVVRKFRGRWGSK